MDLSGTRTYIKKAKALQTKKKTSAAYRLIPSSRIPMLKTSSYGINAVISPVCFETFKYYTRRSIPKLGEWHLVVYSRNCDIAFIGAETRVIC